MHLHKTREEILRSCKALLGAGPREIPPLDPQQNPPVKKNGILRYHVSFSVEKNDRITAWLLVPDAAPKPLPAVICIHGTTRGSGKDRVAGLAGMAPGTPPDDYENSRAYGLELARRGYITLCPDLLCDGERVYSGKMPYDSSPFYKMHPEWSMVGKNSRDISRCVDFLLTRDEVDGSRIGCMGHSLGGHTTVFSMAFDERIKTGVSNGGVLSWLRDSDHWSRPEDFHERDSGPAAKYVYITRFRKYIDKPSLPLPVKLPSLFLLTLPRPVLVMGTEEEMKRDEMPESLQRARKEYEKAGAGDCLETFSYAGSHSFPPEIRARAYEWFDKKLRT